MHRFGLSLAVGGWVKGNNGRFFVYCAALTSPAGSGALTIARYQVSIDPHVANPDSSTVLLSILHPSFTNHNGSMLAFGPDGYRYADIGDGSSGGDPNDADGSSRSESAGRRSDRGQPWFTNC